METQPMPNRGTLGTRPLSDGFVAACSGEHAAHNRGQHGR